MKRIILVAVAAAVAVTGCASDPGNRTSETGSNTAGRSAASLIRADWLDPVNLGDYTIMITKPVDATEQYPGGPGRVGVIDVMITAGEKDVPLAQIQFTGTDDNWTSVGTSWLFQVGDDVLPAGKTRSETGVQIHYSERAKTDALILYVTAPDGTHLAKWTLP